MIEKQPENTVFSPGWSGFTSDWFTHRIPAWRKHILPAYKDKFAKWLEIGSYEGRSAIWTLANILTHKDSQIVCIDPWLNEGVETRFNTNIMATGMHDKVQKLKGFSTDLIHLLGKHTFDVVYVDGDHQAKSALADAVHAWRVLKPGGYLIFDDYKWNFPQGQGEGKIPASKGIDAFLEFFADELNVVHHDYQVIVQKK